MIKYVFHMPVSELEMNVHFELAFRYRSFKLTLTNVGGCDHG